MWDGPPTRSVELPAYRIILVQTDGTVADTKRVEARDDAEAMDIARNASGVHTVELWDGLRFIEQFTIRVGT